LRYSDFWLLFNSKYSLVDKEDPILAYNKKIMNDIDLEKAKEWFKLWLWDWKRPRDNMSRQEVMTVLLRTMEKYGVKK